MRTIGMWFRWAFTAAVFAAVVGIAAFAGDEPPPATQVIAACKVKTTGAIRIVTPSTKCKTSEVKLTWNVVGPRGPAGPKGATGATGSKGDTGATGQRGPAGLLDAPGFARTTIDTVGDVGQFTSIAVGIDGLGVVSYYDVSNRHLKVAHCSNVACTAATVTTIDSADNVGQHSSLAIGSDGLALIGYYESGTGSLKVAHCSNVACTSATTRTVDSGSNSGANDVGKYAAVMIGGDGLGYIGYYDATAKRQWVAHCSDLACMTASKVMVQQVGTEDKGRNQSGIISPAGFPILVSYEPAGQLLLTECLNVDCSSALTGVYSNYKPGYRGVAVGSDGFPVVAGSTANALVLSHCELSGALANVCDALTSPLGPSQNGGPDVSDDLAVVNSGTTPTIVYRSTSNDGDLKVGRCSDVLCDLRMATAVVDGPGATGFYPSATRGVDGNLLISYYDQTNGALRVMHCGSAWCTPYSRD